MADLTKQQETQEEQGQRSEPVHLEEECCVPFCGPETCGIPLTGEPGLESPGRIANPQAKVVKLTSAGARRLFNGEDDEIYSRADLIEDQPDGSIKVSGACTGTIWLVQADEIAAIVDA